MFRRSKEDDPPRKTGERAIQELQKGRLAEAADYFRRAIAGHRQFRNYQDAADLGYDAGFAMYENARHDEARTFLEAAIHDYRMVANQGSWDGTPQYAVTASALINAAECYFLLGRSQAATGQYPTAIRNLRKAAMKFMVEHHEKRAGDGFLALGAALRDYGIETKRERPLRMALVKFDLASQHYRKAVRCGENGAETGPGVVYISAAPAFFALGRYREVIDAYPKVGSLLRKYGNEQQIRWASETYEEAHTLKTRD